MTSLKQFKENLGRKDIMEVPFILARLEREIYELKRLGEARDRSCKLNVKSTKRNYARKRMLFLLKEWELSGYKSKPLTYADTFNKYIDDMDEL